MVNKITELFDNEETRIEKIHIKLDEFKDINGMKEFISSMTKFNKEKEFKKLVNELEDFYKKTVEDNTWHSDLHDQLPFFKIGKKILKGSVIPIYFQSRGFVDYIILQGVSFLIEFNYYINNKDENLKEIFKKSYAGDFIANLSKNVEGYTYRKFIEYNYEKYFKKIKNITYATQKAQKLNDLLSDYVYSMLMNIHDSSKLFSSIYYNSIYLMACSAVKNNRNVTCEDVVLGYNLTFKLLTEDLTEYIERDYNEKKVSQYDLINELDNIEFNDEQCDDAPMPFLNSLLGTIIALLSGLEFIFLIVLFEHYVEFFRNPLLRIPVLIGFFIIIWFVKNYLTCLNDDGSYDKYQKCFMILLPVIIVITCFILVEFW